MRRLLITLVLAAAACSPPTATPPAEAPPAAEAEAEAPALDYGPYTGSWDSAEFSRFRHTLHARSPGAHTVTLQATTDSPGGETVAVYPVRPDGERGAPRIVFVVADRDGENREAALDFPAGDAGVQVEVAVENAGGRRHAGAYTLTVGD